MRGDDDERRTRGAFSLVELLVVVAVMALLSAILFTVFSRVREGGRSSVCQSNLKQIGVGLLLYQQDYDQKMPGRVMNRGSWRMLVLPYVKNVQVFNCPSHQSTIPVPAPKVTFAMTPHPEPSADPTSNPTSNPVPPTNIDTATNFIGRPSPDVEAEAGIGRSYLAPTPGDPSAKVPPTAWLDNEGRSLAEYPKASTTILLVEGEGERSTQFPLGNADWAWAEGSNHEQGLFAGHTGGANFLFVDGHVESRRPLQVINEAAGHDEIRKNLFALDNTKLSGLAFQRVDNAMEGAERQFR